MQLPQTFCASRVGQIKPSACQWADGLDGIGKRTSGISETLTRRSKADDQYLGGQSCRLVLLARPCTSEADLA
jgi:hypothetical protein